jgi:1,4-dihydroxy-2-naphthoyl-CoA hydrolase
VSETQQVGDAAGPSRSESIGLGPRPDLTDPVIKAAYLAALNEMTGQLNTLVGLTFTDVEPGRLTATMPVEGNRQPYGLLHGGASCVLAEALGSTAASLNAPAGRAPVGVDINATHHRAAVDGIVTGICTPLHEGRTTATYSIAISDEAGRRVCSARLTCQYIERR